MSRIFTPAEKEIINEYLIGQIEYFKECIQFHRTSLEEGSEEEAWYHTGMIKQYEDHLHRAVFNRERLNHPIEEER